MIPLHQIQIQTPCHANWENMTGNAQARFCVQCKKTVHNISEMTASDAQALLSKSDTKVCVRLTRTVDGQVQTRDMQASKSVKKTLQKPKRPVQPITVKPRRPELMHTTGEPMAVPTPPTPMIGPPMPAPPTAMMGTPMPPPPPPTPKTMMGDVAYTPPPPPPPTHTMGKVKMPEQPTPPKPTLGRVGHPR